MSERSVFPDYSWLQRVSLFLCGAGKASPRTSIYSVVIFSYSGLLGILGSDGNHNTAFKAGARGRENCCTFH